MSDLTKYDNWLTTDSVAAIVVREPLIPVEGADGVIFPATYAAAEDKKVFPGGYNIDPPPGDKTTTVVEMDRSGSSKMTVEGQATEKNVCLVDSVGSQANRMEPIFAKPEYAGLVPQVVITAGEKSVNLLEAGHRAGDAIVRCTSLQKTLQEAFKAVLNGDALKMAKIAPTSLVFGVWDSRDTQAKLPRLVASTIRAFDVQRLTRSAQFNPSTDYIGLGLLEDTTDTKLKDAYAERGFIHVLPCVCHLERGSFPRGQLSLSSAGAIGAVLERSRDRRHHLGRAGISPDTGIPRPDVFGGCGVCVRPAGICGACARGNVSSRAGMDCLDRRRFGHSVLRDRRPLAHGALEPAPSASAFGHSGGGRSDHVSGFCPGVAGGEWHDSGRIPRCSHPNIDHLRGRARACLWRYPMAAD